MITRGLAKTAQSFAYGFGVVIALGAAVCAAFMIADAVAHVLAVFS